jgi:hypothetical protein
MTLLELIVAIVVGGLAMTIGFAVLGSRPDSGDRLAAFYDDAITDGQIQTLLQLWIAGTRLSPDGTLEFRGVDGQHEDMDDAEVVFQTTSGRAGRPVTVRLIIDRDVDTPERGLVAELVDLAGYRSERVELARAAVGLRTRYLSGLPSDTTWFPSWISRSVLPRGIEIVVQAAHPDSLPLSLRRPIRMPLGVVW